MATDDRQSASAQRVWACGGEAVDRSRAYAIGGEETARIAYEQGRFAWAFLSLAGLHLHRPGGRRREGDGTGPLMRASAFETDEFIAHLIAREEVAELQAFIESNPEYWLLTHGHRPRADDAAKSFGWLPPADMGYSEHLSLLVRQRSTRQILGQL